MVNRHTIKSVRGRLQCVWSFPRFSGCRRCEFRFGPGVQYSMDIGSLTGCLAKYRWFPSAMRAIIAQNPAAGLDLGRKSAQAGVSGGDRNKGPSQVERIRWRMDTMKNSLIAFSLVILFSFGVAAQSDTTVASNSAAESAVAAKSADVQTPNVVPLIGAGTGVVAELSNNINAK